MKKLSSGLLCIAMAIIFTSCGGDKSTTDTTNTSTMSADSTDAARTDNMMSDTGMNSTDHNMDAMASVDLTGAAGPANFTSKAASGGMMEVEAAKAAQNNASSKDVKDLAKMIMDDHNKANSELKKIATSKNITVPAAMMSEHKSHVDMLSAKKGAEFDKAYIDMMETDHNKDIDLFNQASNTLTDPELKAFAAKTLPTLQKHLDKVKSIKAKM